MSIQNPGLGPGTVRWMDVMYAANYQENWKPLLEKISGIRMAKDVPNDPANLTIRSGDSKLILALDWDTSRSAQDADTVAQQVMNLFFNDFRYDLCYCSLYGECWLNQSALGHWQVKDFGQPCPAAPFGKRLTVLIPRSW